jgi:two-component system response regulator MprA
MKVLVVEDEPKVREALVRALRLAGYRVALAADGEQALQVFQREHPDVVVLDVLMPRLDGLEVCRRLRAAGEGTPVLMLTARDAIDNRVEGLDAGADDYLVKPFALEELKARLRALTRRRAPNGMEPVLRYEDLSLDPNTRDVQRAERTVQLTRTEFALAELFLRNPRTVLTRSLIFERVWGYDVDLNTGSLDVYISYLRRKLEADGEPRLIHTVRGVGYVLRVQ